MRPCTNVGTRLTSLAGQPTWQETASAETIMTAFKVEKMSCDHCAKRVTQAVQKVEPTAKVTVDLKAARVDVDKVADAAKIAAAITAAGYPATEMR